MLPALQGVIQAILLVPVTLSFSAIIFKHPCYAPYLPALSRLVLASSLVHQACFALWSGLLFAVGQVQDAGLIFLSAIASNVAQHGAGVGAAPAAVVATTLFTHGACTAALGVMLIVAGRLKLASLVQYLPMPVIGGYLAYIGFFCGQAGVGLMAGVELDGVHDWGALLECFVKPLCDHLQRPLFAGRAQSAPRSPSSPIGTRRRRMAATQRTRSRTDHQ